jgi:NSS family neurotransmitter:Na+ symporter
MGFLMLSAGCAIGLGNVWRFPYITGRYGGALFVIIYIAFLIIFGIPIMTMEFSVGRASQLSVAKAFNKLEPRGTKWHVVAPFMMAGNYLLMMFYTTVSGWMLAYLVKEARGDFSGVTPQSITQQFGALTGDPKQLVLWMMVVCILGFGVCAGGLQKGVEKITKFMMTSLLVILIVLVVRAVTLPNAGVGLAFYLKPSLSAIREHGIWETTYAAMGQSFFTLSLGVGSMEIFGSYLKKERSLFGESIFITCMDTFVAIMSGLVIFPACFAFGIKPDSGPNLIFLTLPNIFNHMPIGRLWGTLFFIFMAFAAMSTVIAVFENIIAFAMDLTGCTRQKSVAVNFVAMVILSLPCALGFNLLSGVSIPKIGGFMDLEDFLLSNNLLPLGSLVFLLFCMIKKGWGWDQFITEADSGKGIKFPAAFKPYFQWGLPILLVVVFVAGYIGKFVGN